MGNRPLVFTLAIILLASTVLAADAFQSPTGFALLDDIINFFFPQQQAFACTRVNPAVAITPATQSGAKGTTLDYRVTVQNNDNGCPATSFTLTCNVFSGTSPQTGWTCSTGLCTDVLPGSTCTVPMTVTSPSSAASGTYDINVNAVNSADNTKSDTGSTRYVIAGLGSPCPPHGDVNGDGLITSQDALLVQRHVAQIETLKDYPKMVADVDGDGDVDSVDSLKLLRYVGGIDIDFPICTAMTLDITTTQLVRNATGTIDIIASSPAGLIDTNNVSIRHSTILPIREDPRQMVCINSNPFVAACSYIVTTDSGPGPDPWRSPMNISVVVKSLNGGVRIREAYIPLVTTTTTTSTTTTSTTTTTLPPTTTTTIPVPGTTTTTTTTSTTTTTIVPASIIINVKTAELTRNVTGRIDVDVGSPEGRININNITIRHTSVFANILTDPIRMTCTGDSSLAACTYSVKPDVDWITPMKTRVIVADRLGGQPQQIDANINLVNQQVPTTTTTTVPPAGTTTTVAGGTTTTIAGQTTTTTVPPADSCRGRCGDRAPSGCWCDAQCTSNSDCCPDYQSVCTGTPTTTISTTTTVTLPPGETTTTLLGQTTTTISTTTTTLPVEGIIVNITNHNLLLNRTNEIKVIVGDSDCRIDRNNIYVRYTTFLPVKTEPRKMICTDAKCVVQCTYTVAPDSEWLSPVELTLILNISRQIIEVDKNLEIVAAAPATTTTTLRSGTTTTIAGATTTTVAGTIDLRSIIPDLRKLQQDLNSVKADVDDLAERLRETGDIRYRKYLDISGNIDDAVDKINDVISIINKDPTSQTSKQRVVSELTTLKSDIEKIADDL